MKKRIYGATLLQYSIILAIIMMGVFVAYSLLGQTINKILTNYSSAFGDVAQQAQENASTSNNNDSGKTPDTTVPENTINTINVSGIDLYEQSDGSIVFNIGSKQVDLSPEIISDINEVMETTGTNGLNTEVISAFQKMILEHQDEYPNGDVPVEISFGDSIRNLENGSGIGRYEGTADINTCTLNVGDHVMIMVNDQSFEGELGVGYEAGFHVIEGYKNGNKFPAQVVQSSTLDMVGTAYIGTVNGDDFEGEIDTSVYGTWDIITRKNRGTV